MRSVTPEIAVAEAHIRSGPRNPHVLYCASENQPPSKDIRTFKLSTVAVLHLLRHETVTASAIDSNRKKLAAIVMETTRGSDKSGGETAALGLLAMRQAEPNVIAGFAIASLLMNDPRKPELYIAYSGTGGVYVAHTKATDTAVVPGQYSPDGLDIYYVPGDEQKLHGPGQFGFDQWGFTFNSDGNETYAYGGIKVFVGLIPSLIGSRLNQNRGLQTNFPYLSVRTQEIKPTLT